MAQKVKADPESFVHRVRHKYDTVDKNAIDEKLQKDREEMNTDDFEDWGYPPGIYWRQRDADERAKEIWRDEKVESAATSVRAYHGSNTPIKKFDRKFSNQGIFWFSEDKEKILSGNSGARSTKYLIEVDLHVNKTAGWSEYNNLTLGELKSRGYDSVRLPSKEGADWIVFDSKNIKVIQVEDTQKETTGSKSVGLLYHFLDLKQLERDLVEDRLIPHRASSPLPTGGRKIGTSYTGKDLIWGVSMTRNPSWKPSAEDPGRDNPYSRNRQGYWAPIRLTLDGTKLSAKYKIGPYNAFYNEVDLHDRKLSVWERKHTPETAESEEKIYTDQSGVKNFLRYVKSIEVLKEVEEEFKDKAFDNKLGNIPVTFVDKFSSSSR